MIDREDVLNKIGALLETKGRTPEEAALYVAKANELAEKHGIALYELTGRKDKMRSDVRETAVMDVYEKGKPQQWRWNVLQAAAKAAGVRAFHGWRTERREATKKRRAGYRSIITAYFVGLPVDVEVAGYTYDYLVREIERLAKEHAKVAWDAIADLARERGLSIHDAENWYVDTLYETHPLKREASFRKGAAYGITEALEKRTETRQATDDNTLALVVDRDAAIADYLSIKAYGKTVAEMNAQRAEKAARMATGSSAVTKPEPKIGKWTKTDQRRLESSLRRQERAEQARQNAYWRGVDVSSWKGGREAGQKLQVRPGIKGGARG